MRIAVLLTAFSFLFLCDAYSQEYSYTQYDVSDGLAGSTVYCITQDKDGFIWVGTETGVSRFDGTNFHNFTTSDGLPDVEVLEMFGDSRGRVWMAPFSKSICYYFKGKIYNQTNDPLLRQMRFRSNIEHFAEDKDGNILIQEPTALHLLGTNGSVSELDSIEGRPIRRCAAISRSHSGHFLVQDDRQVFDLSGAAFTLKETFPFYQLLRMGPTFIALNQGGMMWWADEKHAAIRSFTTGKELYVPYNDSGYQHITYSVLDDSLFFFNSSYGAIEYNLHSGKKRRFLPGKQVSRTYRDTMGNVWFTTLGRGLFRLNSDEFKTIRLQAPGIELASAFSIAKVDRQLLIGSDQNSVFFFSLPDMSLNGIGNREFPGKIRVLGLGPMPNGNFYGATDGSFWEFGHKMKGIRKIEMATKSVFAESNEQVLTCGYFGVFRIDLGTFRVTDTLWRERATAVCRIGDTIYIGTLNGLYTLSPDRSAHFLGKRIPLLQKRISAFARSDNGMLWVATYDAGVIGYKDGQIVTTLTRQQGLASDICRTLYAHANDLWIGTDKGLNRVRMDQRGYSISRYTSKDGLGSDIVNTIFVDDSTVYVGTPAGLSYFNESRVDHSEGCPLYWLSVINSGKERIDDTSSLVLPYSDKHLRLEFAGISYRSVGGISYQYRLLGLDTTWRTTKESFLDFLSLPSGTYTLQLQATNKFGRKSNLLALPFEVATPWWQTVWFNILVAVSLLLLTWFVVSLRVRHFRKRQKEKEQLTQRMMELEHMALQAQMNPHFIFNCLNSIQQFVFDQDVLAANKYLTGFSKLIRATLHNSSKAFIPLSEEVSYLSGYLSLERLRFEGKMEYLIDVDPLLQDDALLIPPMLIQPYVENSMRHGLRHKTEGNGFIHLHFRKIGDRLSVIAEDNGIGRKAAAAFKTGEHIEYQSKGMSLAADRVRMINARNADPIRIEIVDLEDASGQPAGTRVVIEFPLFHHLSENEVR